MRILILSCSTGEGHNMAGKAALYQMRAYGCEADMIDMMCLSGRRTKNLTGGIYVGIVTHFPRFFQFLYRIGGILSSPSRKSPVYYANALMAKHVKKFLEEHDYDAIVTPHLFPAETLTYMKKHGMLKQKTVAVMTDYTCIPFWEETDCDYYVIPHEDLKEEFVKRGLPSEKLLPFGIPVSRKFAERKDKRKARMECGLPPETLAYLIMSGSMGFGKIALFAAKLSRQCTNGEQIVILCGRNAHMRKVLRTQFWGNKNVHILGFTKQVSLYMDACDVVFTKPGGLSSTEAAVKRIPIVHTSPIPGCETKNLEFFTSRGISVSARTMEEQIAYGRQLIHDPMLRRSMLQSQEKQIRPDAAQTLALFLDRLV